MQTIPLYVRSGSIVPIALPAQSAKVSDWQTLQIRVYPGADGEFTLYEDEGDRANIKKYSEKIKMIEAAMEEDRAKLVKEIEMEDKKLQEEEPQPADPEHIDIDEEETESVENTEDRKPLVKRLGKKK